MLVWVAPLIAAIGVVATAFVLRTRSRVRASLYDSLREERQKRIAEARSRAGSPRPFTVPVDEGASAPELQAVPPTPLPGASQDLLPAVPDPVPEARLHAFFGYLSLAAALLTVLLGVVMLIGQFRP